MNEHNEQEKPNSIRFFNKYLNSKLLKIINEKLKLNHIFNI